MEAGWFGIAGDSASHSSDCWKRVGQVASEDSRSGSD